MVLQEMQRNQVYFQSKEQRREVLKLLDLENVHSLFDELIQRASSCVSSSPKTTSTSASDSRKYGYSNGSASASTTVSTSKGGGFDKLQASPVVASSSSSSLFNIEKERVKAKELVTRDDSYVKKSKSTFYSDGYGIEPSLPSKLQILDSSLKATTTSGQDGDKLSLIKLASLIEVSAKKGTREIKMQNKLMDQDD